MTMGTLSGFVTMRRKFGSPIETAKKTMLPARNARATAGFVSVFRNAR
jgi:hypothetical protein